MRSQDGEGKGKGQAREGKGREGKEREEKERNWKWKGHGSQWLDGCDVGNAPSSERASTFHLFPIQQNCFHPPFIPLSSSHSPPQQLHPPPPPPPQHFPIISHQPHTSPPSTCLSAVCLSPHQPPRAPIALGEEKRREKRREEKTQKQQLIHLPSDLPPVKPSAIALGTLFNHAASLAVLGPVFGDTYRRAMQANSNEEFFKSKEAASAGAAWGTSLIGSAVQSYGVGALINATGTLSYKGAAYLGALIFAASSAPSVRPFHHKFPSHH